jgi:hypothetical protein
MAAAVQNHCAPHNKRKSLKLQENALQSALITYYLFYFRPYRDGNNTKIGRNLA